MALQHKTVARGNSTTFIANQPLSDSNQPSSTPLTSLEQLDADLLVSIVYFVDTRWHHAQGPDSLTSDWVPLEPFAVCALACVCHTLTSKLRLVRPAIRTGSFGQARSGALHRKLKPGPIQSVTDAVAFERRSVWQVGQLSSLSYSQVDDVAGLAACRMLHTLQLTQCKRLHSLDGLGACPSLTSLFVVNAPICDAAGLRNAAKLCDLELSGCTRLTDISALATCAALASVSLTGSKLLRDISALGACKALQTLDLIGCREIDDIRPLHGCPRLWKLDVRGTAYTRLQLVHLHATGAVPPLPTPPSVTELRGPGWQDVGTRGRVMYVGDVR